MNTNRTIAEYAAEAYDITEAELITFIMEEQNVNETDAAEIAATEAQNFNPDRSNFTVYTAA